MPQKTNRRGSTLLEMDILLVFGSVVLLVIASGIHQGREEARRAECKYNLKQLSRGLSNYNDMYGLNSQRDNSLTTEPVKSGEENLYEFGENQWLSSAPSQKSFLEPSSLGTGLLANIIDVPCLVCPSPDPTPSSQEWFREGIFDFGRETVPVFDGAFVIPDLNNPPFHEVQGVLADGRVITITESLDLNVYRTLGNRKDGQLLEGFGQSADLPEIQPSPLQD